MPLDIPVCGRQRGRPPFHGGSCLFLGDHFSLPRSGPDGLSMIARAVIPGRILVPVAHGAAARCRRTVPPGPPGRGAGAKGQGAGQVRPLQHAGAGRSRRSRLLAPESPDAGEFSSGTMLRMAEEIGNAPGLRQPGKTRASSCRSGSATEAHSHSRRAEADQEERRRSLKLAKKSETVARIGVGPEPATPTQTSAVVSLVLDGANQRASLLNWWLGRL
jgi:hypothetical protein